MLSSTRGFGPRLIRSGIPAPLLCALSAAAMALGLTACIPPLGNSRITIENRTSVDVVLVDFDKKHRYFIEACGRLVLDPSYSLQSFAVEPSAPPPLHAVPIQFNMPIPFEGAVVETFTITSQGVQQGGFGTVAPCSGEPPSPPPAPPTPDVALTWANNRVTVTPSTSLHDGDLVRVSVTGYGINGKVYIYECASAEHVSTRGCGGQVTVLSTDAARAGSVEFVVHVDAPIGPLASATAPCLRTCVIVASMGPGYAFGFAPISFANPVTSP